MRTKLGMIVNGAGIFVTMALNAQPLNPLQFTGVGATVEGAIQLRWQSDTNALYQVQYTPQPSDDVIAWAPLVDNYPSHGSNTLWLDTGNYLGTPQVNRPKYDSARFYRVVYLGTNPVDPPSVTVTFPTNGMVLSGQVTVSVATASSTLPYMTPALHVDGQEMYSIGIGTDFVINTCEWPNGPHILFATVQGQDGLASHGDYSLNVAYGASPYVPVTFSNLISRVAFSEQFFEPSLGQTQVVTASFAASVNWTLEIKNEANNTIRFASGSGTSMAFDWDGTGTNGVSIPNGIYNYFISAQTNGQAFLEESSGGGDTEAARLAPLEEGWYPRTAKQALAAGLTSYFVKLPPLPPYRSNGVWVAREPEPLREIQIPGSLQEGYLQTLNAQTLSAEPSGAGFSGAAPQSTEAPTRPQTATVKDTIGQCGVGYFNFYHQKNPQSPSAGIPGVPSVRVQIEGSTGNHLCKYLPESKALAQGFAERMQKGGWKMAFNKNGNDPTGNSLTLQDLRSGSLGGNEIFGSVTVGLLSTHGDYGTSPDYHNDAGQSLMTYLVSDAYIDGGDPWLRLSELGTGGDLRYMGLWTCFNFHDNNYMSMYLEGVLPIKSNLHLLCASDTVTHDIGGFGLAWARRLCGDPDTGRQNVPHSWFNAGHEAYGATSNSVSGTVVLRVAGWTSTFNETVLDGTNTVSGGIGYQDEQVNP